MLETCAFRFFVFYVSSPTLSSHATSISESSTSGLVSAECCMCGIGRSEAAVATDVATAVLLGRACLACEGRLSSLLR